MFHAKPQTISATFDAAKDLCAEEHGSLPIAHSSDDLRKLCALGHPTWLDMKYLNKKEAVTFGYEIKQIAENSWMSEMFSNGGNFTHGQIFQSADCKWTAISDLDHFETFVCLQYIPRTFRFFKLLF